MDPLKGRMDFEFETMRGELVREIEAAVNHEVAQSREIRVKILPREEAFQIPRSDSHQDQPASRRHSASPHGGDRRVWICKPTAARM
jgi:Ser-tRNA(Ala) deacylase AlaX